MKLFDLDNPIFRGINKFVDCMFLSALWVIFSIPLITIGVSTSAAYYTANKVLRHNRGYVFQQFWQSFRSSLKQGIAAWMICVIMWLFLQADMRITDILPVPGIVQTMLRIVLIMAIVVTAMASQYAFPYIARFRQSLKRVIQNSILISCRHLPWTMLLIFLSVICILLTLTVPILIFVTPCVWAIISSLIIERIFQRYMTQEDLEKEKNLNSGC